MKYELNTSHTIGEDPATDRTVYWFEDENGNEVLKCTAPPGWNPGPIATARLVDALRSTFSPSDHDQVPVSCVMDLVGAIAQGEIRKLAEVNVELANAKKALCAEQQKVQALSSQLHLYVSALVRAFFQHEQRAADINGSDHIDAKLIAMTVTDSLYQTIDRMNPKPDQVNYLVDVIRRTGATWNG